MIRTRASAGWLILCLIAIPWGQHAEGAAPPAEEDYYRILTFEPPAGMALEVGALEWMPDGKLAVSTRRGEIYLVENALSPDPAREAKIVRFAHGLHEVLGLAHRDGWLYATQRGEITRIKDEDGDGVADRFETVADGWGIDGDYHEYAFGSKFDREGNLWATLCLTGSFSSKNLYRGWALRIGPDGKLTPTCGGIRSPGGMGMNAAGDMFMTDNQGPWNGACSLKHLKPGSFQGHPAGNRWYDAAGNLGPAPAEPKSGSRMAIEAARIPELVPPAVYFPYPKMGQSASGIACDETGGKFGPFAGQMFVGDQASSFVMRVPLEVVGGRYQGACIPFRKGFASGCLPLLFAPDGSMIVGETNRGWGSRGGRTFGLERVVWTGKTPFEILDIRIRPDGFDLRFTEPVDPKTAGDPASYAATTHTYIYQSAYGSPEVDPTAPKVERATVSEDGRSVRLVVGPLQKGHVHTLNLDGVRSADGRPLLHPEAYYTANTIPEAPEVGR
ncbi:PQQ-dependent sugar dehydrogenase [Tundrisphaera sp. TA3]|uniref:PQQ-dependent sugar dehydrogenase n=1 Tax=Tundrisphaera sp. TA3 TaxID=3435775 RepID=UPI003EB6969F